MGHQLEQYIRSLMYGVAGMVRNALGFTSVPTIEQILARAQVLAMDDFFAKGANSPTLAINGDTDVHVPLADLKIWEGRPNTDVILIPGGTHCAINKLDQLVPPITNWLASALR
jgi:esterase FrsA